MHRPLLEYRHAEVNCNVYNTGAPAFSIALQKKSVLAIGVCANKHDYTVTCVI